MGKLHKVELKTKDKTKPTTGSNCELFIDGKPVKGCTEFSFGVKARERALVKITMIADVSVDAVLEKSEVLEHSCPPLSTDDLEEMNKKVL